MKNRIIYLLLLLLTFVANAQEKDKVLPEANEEYVAKNFVDAEANYRISHSKFPGRTVALYNLGNSIYRQNQFSESKFAYANALKSLKTRTQKHKAFHNLGNVFMKEKDYTQAVAAYKDALRNDPTDEETRYNYALAKKMLKDNPPPKDDKKKDKNKDKDKDKDKNKDKKDDKNKDKDKKDDKKDGDQNKKEDKPKNDKAQPKPKPGDMSKQRTENLLDAVNNEEKKIQDKVNANKMKGAPRKAEKDW
ncbi:tetratricopeptide repeat protein [Flavobacterium aquiphilum]|uniref:tetratricopeptide repeat protein n=1 Tax=Flavobacterium aquiphilum TaxID=3003261 RepID=UPI002481955D|nr:tetratricopeptide repeat protein [Flavobacterium aquiphilum]